MQFRVADITVIDRAGNELLLDEESNTHYESNTVYLDSKDPAHRIDTIKPTISIKSTREVTKRIKNRNLYNDTVELQVSVDDPNHHKSSSGLSKVWYTTKVNGKDEVIKYNDDNPNLANYGVKTEDVGDNKDSKLTYSFNSKSSNKNIVIRKNNDKYQTNDIQVTVYAMRELFKGESLENALKSLDRDKYERYYDSVNLYKRVLSGELATTEEDSIKSSGYVVDTLEAAIWSVLHSYSYSEAVLKAVNLGNDTDTVGAIAGSIAGAVYGCDAIPAEWISKIMNRSKAESIFNSFLATL